MARIRTIKPDFWEDEKLGQLCVLARLTFMGLISQADDDGRGRGSVGALRRILHGFARDVTEENLAVALDELESQGFVRFYAADGQQYYVVRNFTKHQVINKRLPSKLPPPPPMPDGTSAPRQEHSRSDPEQLPEHSGGNGSEVSGTE